jgi:hypothetical protein
MKDKNEKQVTLKGGHEQEKVNMTDVLSIQEKI